VSFVFIESLSETVPSRRSPDSGFAFGLGRNLGTSAEPCAAYTCSLWNGGLCTKTRVCKLVPLCARVGTIYNNWRFDQVWLDK